MGRVEVTVGHFLRDFGCCLVDTKIIRCHVHVSNSHERAAHVYHGRALICMIVVIIAHITNVGRCSCARLKILHTLDILARIRCLLFLLALVRQIRLIPTRCSQFALGRVSIFVDIDARVHLLGLLWSDGAALGGAGRARAWHGLPFTLSGAFDSVTLSILGSDLRDRVASLPRRAISERMADPTSKLLLEILLSLLRNQFSSLRSACSSNWCATTH